MEMSDDLERQIWVESSKDFNGTLKFQSLAPIGKWLKNDRPLFDGFDTLRNWMFVRDIEDNAQQYGLELHFVNDNARQIYERMMKMASDPFEVDAPFLQKFQLRDFQRIGCNFATQVKRTLILQGTGCLAADTTIQINRGGKSFPIRIDQLVERVEGGGRRPTWDPRIETRVQRREDDGSIRLAVLKAAWYSGHKETFVVTTNTGRTIRATAIHPFLTDRGWRRLEELRVGNRVWVRGAKRKTGPGTKPRYALTWRVGLRHHPRSQRVVEKNRIRYRNWTHQLVAEATLNGLSLERFLAQVATGDIANLQFIDTNVYAVHHLNGDHRDNRPENLKIVKRGDHERLHGEEYAVNVLANSVLEEIVDIDCYGVEPTYDIEVDDDPHNFIANGFVVHNTGKTVCGCLSAQWLHDHDEIDLTILVCKRAKKVDWTNFFNEETRLSAWRETGSRDERHAMLADFKHDVLVTNYEKLRAPQSTAGREDWSRTDLKQIMKMVKGKRVLFIFDEAQKVGNRDSLVSRGVRKLCVAPKSEPNKAADVRIIALTATAYKTAPYNIRNVFSVVSPGLPKVSGTKAEFEEEYVYEFGIWGVRSWDDRKLVKLGRRIEPYTFTALKSDPAIASQFPKMTEREIPILMSPSDRAIYKALNKRAKMEWAKNLDEGNNAANLSIFALKRMLCNTAEAFHKSSSPLAAEILAIKELSFKTKDSAKYEGVEALVETILEEDEKLVLFSFWANAVIAPYLLQMRKKFKKEPIFLYTGNQKEDEQDKQKEAFNSTRGGAIMLMSDAGQEGINLYAPYLGHIELPFTYADYQQRRDRIHRIDSIAKGIDAVTIFRWITQDSVEERISEKVFERKDHAQLIHGEVDVESVDIKADSGSSMTDYYSMMFGDEDDED